MSQGLQNTDLWDYTELIFCHFDNILYCINKSAEDKESLVRTETCAEEMSWCPGHRDLWSDSVLMSNSYRGNGET